MPPPWARLGRARPSPSPAFGAALVVIASQAGVSGALEFRPAWLLPLVSAVLLGASVAIYIPERETPSRLARGLSASLVGVLVLVDIVCLGLLIRGVFVGSALQPVGVLLAGLALWVTNVAVFALVYWELDGDGPESRSDGCPDYLYVSLTAATAFSPTDAMPYSNRAKLAMGMESSICFAVLAMVVARAVNIASG